MQTIFDLLKRTWTFSTAMDMLTHQRKLYLDASIRMYIQTTVIVDTHAICVFVYDRNSAEAIINTQQSFSTLFAEFGGTRSLNAYTAFWGRTISQEVSKPDLLHTSAENIISQMRGIKAYRVSIEEYLNINKLGYMPRAKWWAKLIVMKAFSARVLITFKQLQGQIILIRSQQAHIESLSKTLIQTVNCRDSLSQDDYAALNNAEWHFYASEALSAKITSVEEFIDNLETLVNKSWMTSLTIEMECFSKALLS
eukprot:IDg15848t1